LRLFNLTYRLVGTREESEDILHNLFESIWTKRSTNNIHNLSTYLAVSVRYQAIAYIKSQINMRKFQEYIIFQEISQANLTEQIINYGDLQKAIDEAMKKLPEKTVEVFKKSRYENKSVKEIADELNIAPKTVEYHITKSLKVLKDQLQSFSTLN
jgi:RNA polymerase sigma-70 factor (family 1)